MADLYRSVIEVLKWTEPKSILQHASLTSFLWAGISDSEELWLCHIETLMLGDSNSLGGSPKLQYLECWKTQQKQFALLVSESTVKVFSLRSQSIVKELSFPYDLFNAHNAAALLSDKEVCVCGGDGLNSKRTAFFSLVSGQVQLQMDMAQGRIFHAAVAVSHSVYVFGGFFYGAIKTAERLDLKSLVWKHLPDMHKARGAFAACRKGKLVYITGGNLKECETFNIETERFQLLPFHLPPAQRSFSFVCNGEVVVVCADSMYALGNYGWERRCQVPGGMWSNMSASVHSSLVFLSLFAEKQIAEIDLLTLQFRTIS